MASQNDNNATLLSWLKPLWARKLVQWALAYAAGAWLVIQIADTVGPRWGIEDNISRVFDVVLIVGFFVVLIVAWYHGEKGRQRVSGPELLMLGALLLIGGVALKLVNREQADLPPVTAAPAEDPEVSTDAAATPLQSIAVLPFDNYSPDPDDAYFAAGITEEITSHLSQIGDLTVLSRVAVERAMASGDSLEQIARKLRAGSVLEGSVRMANDRVRITAQLIDMRSGHHLWSDNFDRDLDDIFEIQTNVAIAIGEALRARLTSSERARLEKPLTDNVRAYQLYLKQVELSGNLPEQNSQGIRFLEQALEMDPGFAAALARLAWRHNWQFWTSGDPVHLDQAISLAQASLELDADLATAQFAVASALVSEGRGDEALERYDRALEIDPNFSYALSDSSIWLGLKGSTEPALRRAFRSVQLNPNSPTYRWHGFVPLLLVGDLDRADAWLELAEAEDMRESRLELARVQVDMLRGNFDAASARAISLIELRGHEPETRNWANGLLFIMGRWQDVRQDIEELGRETPNIQPGFLLPRRNRTMLAFVLAESGKPEDANRLFDESLATQLAGEYTFIEAYIDLAAIHAYRGPHDAAMDALEQAFLRGLMSHETLRIDPMFAPLRSDARFEVLLQRMAARRLELHRQAEQAGAFDGYDQLIAAGPIETGKPADEAAEP